MREFLKQNWQIILLEMLVVTIFCVFYGRFGDINIDSFREAYVAQEIINGKMVYKNIFCIYSPLSYLINALLFFVFGAKLSVLYFAGLAATLGIVWITYKTARIFLDNFSAFSILLLIIAGFVLSPNVFNSFFPYSYGILYGLFFTICSIYFMLNKKFPAAYLLCSLAICSKVEFLLLLPILIVVSKKIDWKRNILAFFIPPLLVIICLLERGVSLSDLMLSFSLIFSHKNMTTLYGFYTSMGLVFRPEIILIYFENIIKFFVPYKFIYQEFVIWIFPATLILFFIRYKKLKSLEKLFIVSSLLVSLKVFFALTIQSYGVFYLPLALISFMILIPEKYRKIICVYFLVWSIIIGFCHSGVLIHKNFPVKTDKGIVKTSRYYGEAYGEAISYLKTKDKNTNIVVYPEGLCVNFLSDLAGDSKIYSLTPLYVELFPDNIVVNRLEKTKPDCILISNYDTSAYVYKKFGYDYAETIYEFIKNNYLKTHVFGSDFKIELWERKI